MYVFIPDSDLANRLIRQRRVKRLDHKDEVWKGTYFMPPTPNDEHQEIVRAIGMALTTSVNLAGIGQVISDAAISDREQKWNTNFRAPDVSVFLNGTSAIDKGTHWFGGPDLAVEVTSPGDQSWRKLKFYAKIGVKELLLVDRKRWALELYRLQDGVLSLVGKSDRPIPPSCPARSFRSRSISSLANLGRRS